MEEREVEVAEKGGEKMRVGVVGVLRRTVGVQGASKARARARARARGARQAPKSKSKRRKGKRKKERRERKARQGKQQKRCPPLIGRAP